MYIIDDKYQSYAPQLFRIRLVNEMRHKYLIAN